ncbi:MAG: hypothetical protein Q4D45_00640 [Lachnospiraceae bacterium]|nr:hypothetical protein [Lachnospiraceae bacterium]
MKKELATVMQQKTIKKVFDQRSDFIIIGLTGSKDSNISEIAQILQKDFNEIALPEKSFSKDLVDTLEYKNIYNYARVHWKKFDVIKVRDIIISYLLENKICWKRFNQELGFNLIKDTEFKQKIGEMLEKTIHNYKSKLSNDNFKNVYKLLCEFRSNFIEKELEYLLFQKNGELMDYINTLRNRKGKTINTRINLDLYVYTKYILPIIGASLKSSINEEKYTQLFQKYGNEIRFFGTLDISQWRKRLKKIEKIENFDFYSIAKRINTFIKIRRSPFSNKKSVPVQIVIDSLKNPYEFSFLKDRYSAYYTIALLGNEKTEYNDTKYKTSNYTVLYENPHLIKNNFNIFIHLMIEQIEEDGTLVDSQQFEYLESLKSPNDFLHYMLCILKKADIERKYNFEWCPNIERIYRDLINNTNYKRFGITIDEIKFYLTILKDPVRTFSLISGLYPFYMQDIQNSTQNADIFFKNTYKTEGKITKKLKYQIIKYISLIMHPGLVPPTKVERCMQIAFCAKVNSGCISRQVGAVVTNNQYQILSIGWNDAPSVDIPCVYRDLQSLKYSDNCQIYSDMELCRNSLFRQYIDCYDFSDVTVQNEILEGIPSVYCFKTLYNGIKNERNPFLSRSIHAEARAFSQCDREKTIDGCLFTTSSSCENCTMLAKEYGIRKIYYIENYPGIAQAHVNAIGNKTSRTKFILFEGAIGIAYTKLYTPIIPMKDELKLRGIELLYKDPYIKNK